MFSLAFEQVHAEMSTKEMQKPWATQTNQGFYKPLKSWLGSVIFIVLPIAIFSFKFSGLQRRDFKKQKLFVIKFCKQKQAEQQNVLETNLILHLCEGGIISFVNLSAFLILSTSVSTI